MFDEDFLTFFSLTLAFSFFIFIVAKDWITCGKCEYNSYQNCVPLNWGLQDFLKKYLM